MVFITLRDFISLCSPLPPTTPSSSSWLLPWTDCVLIFNEKLNITNQRAVVNWYFSMVTTVSSHTQTHTHSYVQINQWINFVIACKIQTMRFSIIKTSLSLQMPLITKIYVVYPSALFCCVCLTYTMIRDSNDTDCLTIRAWIYLVCTSFTTWCEEWDMALTRFEPSAKLSKNIHTINCQVSLFTENLEIYMHL